MSALTFLVLHCSATPAGRDVRPEHVLQWHMGPRNNADGTVTYKGIAYANRTALPDEFIGGIHVRQLNGNGWDRPGYSDLILLDGTRHVLVPVDKDSIVQPHERTWGAVGEALPGWQRNAANWISRHICYVGGMSADFKKAEDTRTPAQKETMLAIVKEVIGYKNDIQVAGHNQMDNKACPSFSVPAWLKSECIPAANIYQVDPFRYLRFFETGRW